MLFSKSAFKSKKNHLWAFHTTHVVPKFPSRVEKNFLFKQTWLTQPTTMENSSQNKVVDPANFKGRALGRALPLKIMVKASYGKNVKKRMFKTKIWETFDSVEKMQGKVYVSICDPKLFITPFASSVTLKVDSNFVKAYWNQKPRFLYNSSKIYANGAWVIGPQFNFEEYLFMGHVDNDLNISMILSSLEDPTKFSWQDWTTSDWIYLKDDQKSFLDEYSLDDFRKIRPSIWWMDENPGHGVGAFVYVHESATKQIDSIIVDNCYFHVPKDVENYDKHFFMHQTKDGQEDYKIFAANEIKNVD